MDNAAAVKVRETAQDTFRHLSEDLFSCPAAQALNLLIDAIQRASLAKLHSNEDASGRSIDKGAIVATDMLGCTALVEIELSDDLLLNIGVRVRGDDLAWI